MRRVAVLMSTFNGESFIEEQLVSILAQEGVEVSLFVRDDGSSDQTCNIIKNYVESNKNIKLILGSNLGPARSFLELVRIAFNSGEEYNYYSFADQDDIWKSDKLSSAIKQLESEEADTYYSSVELYSKDEKLNGYLKSGKKLSKKEFMLRNNAAGCTIVFSSAIANLVARYNPNWVEMHDSWIMRVTICTNHKIAYSKESHIMYRIHDNNTCGVSHGFVSNAKSSYLSLKNNNRIASSTAKELLLGYDDLISDKDYYQYLYWLSIVNLQKHRRIVFFRYIKMRDLSSKTNYIKFLFKLFLGRL